MLSLVVSILLFAKGKSKGGAFSVDLLTTGIYSRYFGGLVLGLGLTSPAVILVINGMPWSMQLLATLAMLVGFFAFRLLMFKAAVFEPITHDLAGRFGLPTAS